MLTGIDHVVILVRDLTQAIADYRAAGFTVIPGGEHTGGATQNALIAFADGTYLELIAFRQPERSSSHAWWPRLIHGEGFVDYALRSDRLLGDAEASERRGLRVLGPVDGGRLRPDGRELRWRTLRQQAQVGQTALPFVIQDVTPREQRVPEGKEINHRMPVTRVDRLTVVTAALDATATALAALLDQDGDSGQRTRRDDGAAVRFRVGRQEIELLQPADPETPAGQALDRLGEGPYELLLGGPATSAQDDGQLLAGSLHGASIKIAT